MITTLYAGILALFYIFLSLYVIKGRFKYRLSLGDGGIPNMTGRVRAHANFAEYVPFALLLLLMLDMADMSPIILHILGMLLLTGRVLHFIALTEFVKIPYARQIGMVLTFLMIVSAAFILLWIFFVLRVSSL